MNNELQGAAAVRTGREFENETSLHGKLPYNFSVYDHSITKKGGFLDQNFPHLDHSNKWPHRTFQPDQTVYNGHVDLFNNNPLVRPTIYIIEKKYAEVDGSHYQKLPYSIYLKEMYEKLFEDYNVNVEYILLMSSSWYDNKKYYDLYEYIKKSGIDYYFDEIPATVFGLNKYLK